MTEGESTIDIAMSIEQPKRGQATSEKLPAQVDLSISPLSHGLLKSDMYSEKPERSTTATAIQNQQEANRTSSTMTEDIEDVPTSLTTYGTDNHPSTETIAVQRENQTILLKDGRKLSFTEYGDPLGIPVLYFHGWPGSRLSATETEEAAKSLSVRIISIDRPGYGLSDYKKERTLLDWPDDIVELADQLKLDLFTVIGVSGGGPYAAVCAYKIKERIAKVAIVVGLAPVNVKENFSGMPITERLSWKNYRRFPFMRTLAAFDGMIQYRYFPGLIRIGFPAKNDQALLKNSSDDMNNAAKEAFRQGLEGPRQDLKIYSGDWGFNLQDIHIPVDLWYGANDKNVPLAMGEYYKAQIPNSNLIIDSEGGHLFRKKKMKEILETLTKEQSRESQAKI